MAFQHVPAAKNNENLESLQLPLFSFVDCSHLNYQKIHATSRTSPLTQNFLFTLLHSIKKFFHTIARSSAAKINVPRSNNLWCNNFPCNWILKRSRKSGLQIDAVFSTSEAYSSEITNIRFCYVDMSLKSIFSHRMLQSGFNSASSMSPEHSSLRTGGSQTLLNQFLSDLRSPFYENSNNDININSAASTISLQVGEGSAALIDECFEVRSAPNCVHPIQLGLPFLCGRQRTSSEHSDDIYFLRSTDVNESTDDETNEPDDSEVEEESEHDCEEAEILRHHNIPCLENKMHLRIPGSLKKVRFNLNPEVHIMYTWNFAYRSARKGNWEAFARDRTRFQQRIQRASLYLDPILSSEHRSVVYKCRFADQSE